MKILYKLLITLSIVIGVATPTVYAQSDNRNLTNNYDKSIVAYPIPANTNVFIKLSASIKNEAKTIELVNLIGRKIFETNVTSNDISINNLSQYPEGVYMIVAKDANGKMLYATKMYIAH